VSTVLKSEEDEKIVRYLLGDLAPPEAEQLEERYFCEPPFFDRVADIEQQLIRRYLDGELSQHDKSLFDTKYRGVPELRRKVDFARQLRKEARSAIRRAHWQWVFRPRIVIPVFASVPVVIAVALWFAVENAGLRTEIAGVRTSNAESGGRLARATGILSTDQVFTLTLFPGVEKSLRKDQGRNVPLTPGLKEIRIDFELPGLADSVPFAIDVALVEAPRRPVLSRNGVQSIETTSGRMVMLVARPEELPAGNYVAFVKRKDQGVDEVLESYSFTVLHP
jgi:hypothetical protein